MQQFESSRSPAARRRKRPACNSALRIDARRKSAKARRLRRRKSDRHSPMARSSSFTAETTSRNSGR
jgi:hypothetical protein